MIAVALYHAEPEAWTDAALEREQSELGVEERQRAAAFRFDRDRRLYVVAHAMVRAALAGRVGASPAELVFRQNAHGKPELERDTGVRFSLAHADGMAVCAVTNDYDVGVDVEPLDRRVPSGIAERWFDPSEAADVRACPENDRAERFFTYWTLKEAYVKARGVGLGLGVQHVGFDLVDGGVRFRPALHLEPTPEAWHFLRFRLGQRHQAALALRAPRIPAVTMIRFSPEAPWRAR